MEERITIRERCSRDLAQLGKLLVEVHQSDGYPVEGVGDPEEWLTPQGLDHAWVAEVNNALVGQVILTCPADGDAAPTFLLEEGANSADQIRMLGRLFVHRSSRGLAIGEKLVQAVMNHSRGHKQLLALDVMEKDHAAIRLYERLGWQLLGSAPHHFGHEQSIRAYCYLAPSYTSRSRPSDSRRS